MAERRPASDGALRIGLLAKAAGLSSATLRHYERVGVLPKPARASNGYREYPPSVLTRVQLVQRALACGFTLAELARIFRIRARGGRPCRQVRDLAGRKLMQIEQEIAELDIRRQALRRTLDQWDRQLSQTPRGRLARLLEQLEDPPPSRSRAGKPPRRPADRVERVRR